MRITALEINDVKSVRWVHIKPVAGVNVIAGNNGAGKSTLLDSICYSLGGQSLVPEQPIRDGENSAVIRLELDGDPTRLLPPIELIRRFDREADGKIKSSLTIYDRSSPDREESPAPQTLLNDLLGRTTLRDIPIAFDPLAFCRLSPKEQAGTLRKLVGLDFSEIDAQKAALTAERLQIGRDGTALAGAMKAIPLPPESAVESEPIESIRQAYELAITHNQGVARQQRTIDDHATQVTALEIRYKNASDAVEAAKRVLKSAKLAMDSLLAELSAAKVNVPKPADELIDLRPFVDRMEAAKTAEAARASAAQHETMAAKHQQLRDAYAAKTEAIHQLEKQKAEMMASAPWPVAGLGFDDSGVTYRGRPLAQASSAEQLEVAVSIGCSTNSTLKIMLVREGSLLDAKHQEALSEIAERYGVQVFLEVVGEHGGSHLTMRDGFAIFQAQEIS